MRRLRWGARWLSPAAPAGLAACADLSGGSGAVAFGATPGGAQAASPPRVRAQRARDSTRSCAAPLSDGALFFPDRAPFYPRWSSRFSPMELRARMGESRPWRRVRRPCDALPTSWRIAVPPSRCCVHGSGQSPAGRRYGGRRCSRSQGLYLPSRARSPIGSDLSGARAETRTRVGPAARSHVIKTARSTASARSS